MKLRPCGNTGMKVSEIGLGAWQLANQNDWGINDKQLSQETVQAMYDLWERDIKSDPLPW